MKGEKITDVLKLYEAKDIGGLALNWMLFGHSGHEKRPKAGVLPSYTKCVINNHVKSIGNSIFFHSLHPAKIASN